MTTGSEQDRHASSLPNQALPQRQRITPYVFFTCLMAGSGGLMYGYDLVIAGGVSVMPDFLAKFYPSVLRSEHSAKQDNYCKYNNQVFELYTSSLYMAALFATFFAGMVTRRLGHRATMLSAGILFMLGTVSGTAAVNLLMLMLGRVLLGCGLGFSNHAVPLYLSEIAPASFRGGLNMLFSMNIAFGIFAGNVINYVASHIHPWGWRLSLGLAGVPSVLLIVFSLVLVDTPTNLIRKDKTEKARAVLHRLRGAEQNVDGEMEELVKAGAKADSRQSFRNLLRRRHTPQVVMAVALPFFQQVSGNDAILFYGPFLFKAAGLGDNASLYSTVVTGSVAVLGTAISVFLVDKAGRRTILMASSVVMLLCMAVVAALFAVEIPPGSSTAALSKVEGGVELAMVCLFVGFYKGSWGPLAWVIPSEIFPQDIRSAAQSVTVCVNMLFKCLLAQTFLSMLCAFKYGIFLFFAGWLAVMGTFTLLFLPETKGIPIDRMAHVWESHWFWRRFVLPRDHDHGHDHHQPNVPLRTIASS